MPPNGHLTGGGDFELQFAAKYMNCYYMVESELRVYVNKILEIEKNKFF